MNTSTAIKRNFMKQNVSFLGRQIRFAIGATMIAVALIAAPDSMLETMGIWNIVLLASIPFIAIAIIGWDPIYAMAGKSAYVEGEEDIQQRHWSYPNLGAIERAARFGIGLACLASLLTMSTMQAEMVFALLAIPLIVTAITAWDPLYAALGINSFASRTDVETAELDSNEETLGACYTFPQRAPSTLPYSRAA